MRACLIINPAAGRGAGRTHGPSIAAYLAELGVVTQTSYSQATGDVGLQVKQKLATHPDVVIVAGGDGSVHEAVNGWMQAGGGAPLAIVPVGTGNDFTKMLAGGLDWREACRRITHGHMQWVDIGRCNDFYFANSLGIGFDAQVAMAAGRIRWLRGNLVYAVALLQTLLFAHQTPRVRVCHAAATLETPITLVAVNNGRIEGGAFVMAPDAQIDDGLLDVVVASGLTRLGILMLVPKVLRGTHIQHRAVTKFQTGKLRIESETGLPVHADGEIRYTDAKCLDIEILPRRLKLVV
ncbi:MAG: diacylglycerol/lipid kinase family protein [Gammaproteobacteria bacterium]